MTPAQYTIKKHYKGDTFLGVKFTLQQSSEPLTPIDLTGASIKIQFRERSERGAIVKILTNVSGITISDPLLGIFNIDPFLIDWRPDVYHYDIEVTFVGGTVKTYVRGTLTVIQDITYG